MSEKFDIILSAFTGDYGAKLHVRHVARMVNMNRQTVSAELKRLEDERVLNSEVMGRNKLYFINGGNPKARIFMESAENRRRLEIIEKFSFMSRLADNVDSQCIAIMFGSYAKGGARKNSDVDVIIIGGKRKSDFGSFEKETGKTVHAFEMGEKKFIERLSEKDHLVTEAEKNHICLKNTERFVEIMWEAKYGKRETH